MHSFISSLIRCSLPLFKKQKTFTAFLSSYRNTSGSLGERDMLWEHKTQASVSTAFLSVSITQQKHGVHVFYFFQKTPRREKGKQLVNLDYKNVNSLCLHHHYVNSVSQFFVSIELYKHGFKPISARAFVGLFSKLHYNHSSIKYFQCSVILSLCRQDLENNNNNN